MSKVDIWARIEAATERGEAMAKLARGRCICKGRVRSVECRVHGYKLLGSDDDGVVPHYTDDDGPVILLRRR